MFTETYFRSTRLSQIKENSDLESLILRPAPAGQDHGYILQRYETHYFLWLVFHMKGLQLQCRRTLVCRDHGGLWPIKPKSRKLRPRLRKWQSRALQAAFAPCAPANTSTVRSHLSCHFSECRKHQSPVTALSAQEAVRSQCEWKVLINVKGCNVTVRVYIYFVTMLLMVI